MARTVSPLIGAGLGALLLVGCASQRPVLYPNSTLQQRGDVAGDRAIEGCMQRAEAAGLDYSKGNVARRTAESGAVGGAGGAVVETALFVIDLPDLGGRKVLEAQGIGVHALCCFDGD